MNDVAMDTTLEKITELAAELTTALAAQQLQLTTAESCSGGWIAKALTDVAGSSASFGYGFVTYSNAAKQRLLGVREDTLVKHGAVSEATVREMVAGALAVSGADLAVAVSGVAGPGGGTDEKPVGSVWFAWAQRVSTTVLTDADLRHLPGDRNAVRAATVVIALEGLLQRLPKKAISS